MTKKNKTIIIIAGLVLLVLLFKGGFEREAVIPYYVDPNTAVNVQGELVVNINSGSFTFQPERIHYYIRSGGPSGTVILSGTKLLTSAQKTALTDRITNTVSKTVLYDLSFTSPSQQGSYYYESIVEDNSGNRILQINTDIMTSPSSHTFTVTSTLQCPASYYTSEEVQVSHGTLTVRIYHYFTGTYPNCAENTQDSSFDLICDSGYQPNLNGRQSTCSATSTEPPPSTSYASLSEVSHTIKGYADLNVENKIEGTFVLKNNGAAMTENWILEMQVYQSSGGIQSVYVGQQDVCSTSTPWNVRKEFKLDAGEQVTITLTSSGIPPSIIGSNGNVYVATIIRKGCAAYNPESSCMDDYTQCIGQNGCYQIPYCAGKEYGSYSVKAQIVAETAAIQSLTQSEYNKAITDNNFYLLSHVVCRTSADCPLRTGYTTNCEKSSAIENLNEQSFEKECTSHGGGSLTALPVWLWCNVHSQFDILFGDIPDGTCRATGGGFNFCPSFINSIGQMISKENACTFGWLIIGLLVVLLLKK